MDQLTRRSLVDKIANVIADFDAKELDSTDLEGLSREELACLLECIQYGEIADLREKQVRKIIQTGYYESDGSATSSKPVAVEEKLKTDAVTNCLAAILTEIIECAVQEDAPIYKGDKEVDNWVRLSDIENVINKHLNL